MNFDYVTVNSNYIFTCDRYDVVIRYTKKEIVCNFVQNLQIITGGVLWAKKL